MVGNLPQLPHLVSGGQALEDLLLAVTERCISNSGWDVDHEHIQQTLITTHYINKTILSGYSFIPSCINSLVHSSIHPGICLHTKHQLNVCRGPCSVCQLEGTSRGEHHGLALKEFGSGAALQTTTKLGRRYLGAQ